MVNEKHNIYIIFSSTPYKMGSFIRIITRNKYNHVSISLDSDLKEMYSFARVYKNTPFYGGFVTEHGNRYKIKNKKAFFKICELPVTKQQKEKISNHIETIKKNKDIYLYNTFSAVLFIFHKRINIKNAYTCVEFIVKILSIIDERFDKNRFYTIKDIEDALERFVIYNGDFPSNNIDVYNDKFNERKNIIYNICRTIMLLNKLLMRKIRKSL